MKVSQSGRKKSRIRGMIWNSRVRPKVVEGVISGRTAKLVSPTKPRVTECRASLLTGSLR